MKFIKRKKAYKSGDKRVRDKFLILPYFKRTKKDGEEIIEFYWLEKVRVRECYVYDYSPIFNDYKWVIEEIIK